MISETGLELIYRHGYEGMNMRQLAAAVGVRQGSLYNHFSSKQDLLIHLYERHMGALLTALDEALAGVERPLDQLKTFIAFHVAYHVERKREVFVVNSELRSLEPRNRAQATDVRKRYETRLIDILAAGQASGAFIVGDVPITAFGILGMLSGICTWYDEGGRIDQARLTGLFTDLVLASVKASGDA